ncbi:MAG: Ti-type conjugative transfer relaxase TraA [Hyphomonas sp.]|uniref:Ti-type conjugative transfer relaxase TraA n=1 Tax=Hyphomonas sp. TaxID=87 RepID=UPI001DA40331|nr:Ti-type conjugative transfer relaxase TraA [Hyphomonas sp.]MBA4009002.1 Ti-type conjugative transfer relaxase TraA [Erythrobacter sp.]MBA4228629.1 Ti-type conjugative transfer relaxase TraA [Hyphomonas sp.]
MAIYHLSVKVISRSAGRSAVAAAAYRSAGRLLDERIDRTHDFTNKGGVVHSEVLLPEGAPEHLSDRERLWNAVEASEKRKDAQLSREVEFAIPRELNKEQGIALARDFVQTEFVERGMIADLNVHWDVGADGLAKPHAHIMLTMREVDADGFGAKVRDWNRTELVEQWRERWADHVNQRLAELDIDARIDHRSLEAQGIGLEPQDKIGPAASRMEGRGLEAERIEEHRAIAERNGARIIADPGVALDAITHQQATFTNRDLARFVHRHSDGKDQFDAVMSAVRRSPDLVALGKDGRGEERFTSRQMIDTEQRLQRASEMMAERSQHAVNEHCRDAALARAAERGLVLSGEQRAAFEHVTGERDLSVVVGYAGTGKSAMLGVAREAWESAGYNVRGAALSGIAAEGLENGSGIASRTIASLEHQWSEGREQLTSRDVLVIDEAGMVGTRQMERVLSQAADAGAKVVLVGDPQQLQAIEAGAAFRAIHERHGGVEITEVRRQSDDWQRDATRQLATGRTGLAIAVYEERGMVHAAETRELARSELIERWDRERQASPNDTRIILTHTNDEVRALNEAARERLRDAGELGDDVVIGTDRGQRQFASGDRIMFLRNERELGVKNGTLGTFEEVTPQRMSVRVDDGRSLAFDLKDYAHVDHGYAATIHKAQGMTVDEAHVLATPGMDSHGAYVALSRHRDSVALHYGRDDFADQARLVRTLSRERGKDMASDYQHADPVQAFAERRGITFRERVAEIIRKVPEKVRGIFDGLRLPRTGVPEPAVPERKVVKDPEAELRRARTKALIRHARAVDNILATKDAGQRWSHAQARELNSSRDAFEEVRPHGWRDAEAAYKKNPELAREAGSGQVRRAVQALQLETELRTDPQRRADRFVARWQELKKTGERQYRDADMSGYRATRSAMGDMTKSLQRDPQLESILASRKRELGIGYDTGRKLGAELAFTHGIDLGRGRGLGI